MPEAMRNADQGSDRPVRFVCVGIGGYGGMVTQDILGRNAPPSLARLVAVCDPYAARFPQRLAALRERGVPVYDDVDTMIAREEADAAWLPLPIHLHRPFTERALAAGLHVMCEKPAAGVVQEVDAMIAARDAARRQVYLGFQDIYAAHTRELKSLLSAGLLGELVETSVYAAWPRGSAYYARNQWAGRLKSPDGAWVLDSPLQNAVSHFVNLAMFLSCRSARAAAVRVVDAELYRAGPVENYDTCSLKVGFDDAPPMYAFLTHAAREEVPATIVLRGTRGAVTLDPHSARFEGVEQPPIPHDAHKHRAMLRTICDRFTGRGTDAFAADLEMGRAHSLLVGGVSSAAAVRSIDGRYLQQVTRDDGSVQTCIADLVGVLPSCVRERRHPSELSVPWAAPGGSAVLTGVDSFHGPRV